MPPPTLRLKVRLTPAGKLRTDLDEDVDGGRHGGRDKDGDADRDKLVFFFSEDKAPALGKAAGESVKCVGAYRTLATRRTWRRVLSDHHVAPFVYKGLTYRTVEHAYQAEKIGSVDVAASRLFAVEGGYVLGTDGSGADARRYHDLVVLSPSDMARWDQVSDDVLTDITRAKMRQCPFSARMLRATGSAELWHAPPDAAPGTPPERAMHLETVRDEL